MAFRMRMRKNVGATRILGTLISATFLLWIFDKILAAVVTSIGTINANSTYFYDAFHFLGLDATSKSGTIMGIVGIIVYGTAILSFVNIQF